MRLPQLPRTSRLASSLLAGLLATGVWHPCQPPAPASALVRDGGGSTLRLAVALTPEAATLPPLGLGAAQPPAASATQPPASSAAGAAAAGRTLEAEAKAEAKAQASRLAAQAAAVAGAEREGKG